MANYNSSHTGAEVDDVVGAVKGGSNGLVVKTGTGTGEKRAIAGTNNEIDVANADGVSGNPTLSLSSTVTDILNDAALSTTLASTANGDGASLIGVEDAAGNFTATTVEGVLAELAGSGGGFTQEEIEDFVGAMFSGNTETLITATYQDVDGTIDLVVDNDLSNYDNSTSGFLTSVALDDISDITLTSAAQGDILYRNDTGWVNLGPGTSGQFLQTQGAGANPQWATPAGSGNVSNTGTPANNQFAVWTDATTIEGISALTYDATDFEISADFIPNADGTIDLGSGTNRFANLHVESIDLNGTTVTSIVGKTAPTGDVVGTSDTQTLTNKTIDTASNTITIVEADISDLGSYLTSETDPVVGAVTGIVKANGAGTISAAVADTDYQSVPSEGAFADGDKTKLDGIEAGADVTDAANVETAIENITLTSVSGATGDEVLIVDATDGGLKAVLWQNLPGGISNVVEDTTPQLGGMLDVNGNAIGDGTLELLKFSETASAVNEITVTNAATGTAPQISATGDDTNIDLVLNAKGTGVVKVGSAEVLTNTSGTTLTAKSTPIGADNVLISDSEASDEVKTSPVSHFTNEVICIAVSDETTDLTTGTGKVTFRMPWAMTLSAVRASVTTAPVGSTIIVDINEGGTTILSTKLSIDASEKTSTTAATAAVISDTALADDAEITIDIDQVGSSTAGAGLKVYLIGYR